MHTPFNKITVAGVFLILFIAVIAFVHSATADTSIVVNGVMYQTVEEALPNISPSKRGTIKGQEIAKIGSIAKTQRGDYFIQVLSLEAMDGGVQAFIKAWDKYGDPIGFGIDGTVEIERVRMFNPPVLVPDPNGTIVRQWQGKDKDTGELVTKTRMLREDMYEALLRHLETVMDMKQEKYSGEKIILGKVGNTTSTFASAAGASSPADGHLENDGADGVSWTDIRDGTGGSTPATAAMTATKIGAGSKERVGSARYIITRSVLLFDISAISDIDSINSASLRGKFVTGDTEDTANDAYSYVNVVESCPASNSSFVAGDYDEFEDTGSTCGFATTNALRTHSTDFDISSIAGAPDHTFTGNANMISLTDTAQAGDNIVKLGMAEGHDITNNTHPANTASNAWIYSVDQTGTTDDPIFTVEHGTAPPVLSNLQSSSVTSNSAVITWTTDVSSDSEVTYDTSSPVTDADSSVYDNSMTTSHSMTLTGLSSNTTYYYFASSTSASARSGTSTESSFLTASFNLASLRATNIGSGWADIKWISDVTTDSKVWYSLTSPISATNFMEVYSGTATTSHSLFLGGLLHNDIYYYIAISKDSSGNYSTSTEKQFNTTSTNLCTE